MSKANNKLIHYGDLVFGMSRKVLNFGLMHDEIGSVSSAYHIFEVNQQRIFPEFVETYIRTRSEYYYGMLGASSREGQSLSKDSFNSALMLIPSTEVKDQFEILWRDLAAKKKHNDVETESLANIRDTLLPKLISGELCLGEAEQLTGGL